MDSVRLSKSRFVKGLQCKKYLWWSVHDKNASELIPDLLTEYRFKTGHEIGQLACEQFPGGFQVDKFDGDLQAQIDATKHAVDAGEKILYEASFFADHTFVAVDVLLIGAGGVEIIEVKSSSSLKDIYLDDLAIQYHIVTSAGFSIKSAKVMFLNKACRFPDLSNLFCIEDVTETVIEKQSHIPEEIRSQISVLKSDLPEVKIGTHCSSPYACPFLSRCWPELPDRHISTLAGVGPKGVEEFQEMGINLIDEIVDKSKLNLVQLRQIKSHETKSLIIEDGLQKRLEEIIYPIGFLDFETIAPAVPKWGGCGPYGAGGAMPVQFSFHLLRENGELDHYEWIADTFEDPRPEMARHLKDAVEGANTILVYSASVERNCIKKIISGVEGGKTELRKASEKIVDLLPIVRNHVYHPDFEGSFSIKSVLPALVCGLKYDDLEISEGMSASILLEKIIFKRHEVKDFIRTKKALLEYCKMDTLAMLKLFQTLNKIK